MKFIQSTFVLLTVSCVVSAYAAPAKIVSAWVARDVAPGKKIQITINTRNVPVVGIAAYRVDSVEWLRRQHDEAARPLAKGNPVATWSITFPQTNYYRSGAYSYYSRQVNLPFETPGVYLIKLAGGDQPTSVVVNVTNLALVVKRSTSQSLVWVTDHKKSEPVPGAAVRYFSNAGEAVANGVTGTDGVYLAKVPRTAQRVVVSRGNDWAAVECFAGSNDGHLKALIQTDRPIYRPGQTVFYKAILRLTDGQGYKPVVSSDPSISIQLRDPRDNPLAEQHVSTTSLGSVSGSFKLPQEGMVGPYTIVLTAGKQTAYQSVNVAAYRKPEFKVEAVALAKRYLAGDEARFTVNANYYFGAPVPQAEVRWIARCSGLSLNDRSEDEAWFNGGDGNLYPRDTFANDSVVGEGTAYTDAKGQVTIPLKTNPTFGDSNYRLEITVTDGSRRQVTSTASVPTYAANRRLALSAERNTVAVGDLIPVKVRIADLDGDPQSGKVDFSVVQPVWNEKKGLFVDKVLATSQVSVPSTGVAAVNLPALAEGTLVVRARMNDGTGRVAKTEIGVYANGVGFKQAKENAEPELSLRLGKSSFTPGETVKAYVSANKPKPILVVAEGRDIWRYEVLRKPGGWTLKTSALLSPNAFISAFQWVGFRQVSSNVLVPVPDLSKRLSVSVTPDKSVYAPGDKATVTVRTTLASGKPTPAEVSIGVVDAAIYALQADSTPEPYGFYWGLRPNEVGTYVSAPQEVSGGAYQRTASRAPVRQRFEDTAFWGPVVQTDQQGRGTVTFEMPGNLTQWRTTARAVTGDTRVGMATSTVTATRPLTLRLATPRVLVQGDQLTLIGTVNNRTKAAARIEVSLTSEGLKLNSAPSQEVEVPAQGESKVQWSLVASDLPASGLATLEAHADSSGRDMSDALRVNVPIIPRGLSRIAVSGGAMSTQADIHVDLPADTPASGSLLQVQVSAGLSATANELAGQVLRSGRYGSPSGANQLEAITVVGKDGHKDDIREALALLSRTQVAEGWGWWESCPADPIITSKVLFSLGLARRDGIKVYENLLRPSVSGALQQYDRTNLWEHRALLASALSMVDPNQGIPRVNEVRERAQILSPYARLRLAEALLANGQPDDARLIIQKVTPNVSDGADSAYLPVGDGIGWSASSIDSTAELLLTLVQAQMLPDLQPKLAKYLALPDEQTWLGDESKALVARALKTYLTAHRDGGQLGEVSLIVGADQHPLVKSTVSNSASVELRDVPLTNLRLERKGEGEVFWRATARAYVPDLSESVRGVRLLRRFEVRNDAGVWTELKRTVKPGEPVRCTVVVWGDDIDDAIKTTEPLPAGFEFVDSEYSGYAREEVRDGAVVHYLMNGGSPATFRYYLRAEADGKLVALPAVAQYLRRPTTEGHSAAQDVRVGKD